MAAVDVEENINVPADESRCVFARYVCGDMKPLRVWLEGKPVPVRFVDWYVRGATQPLFLSNPLGGLLVISGLMVESPWMGLCGLVGLFFSTLTAVIFRQDKGCVESGGGGFNGLLTGLLLTALSRDPDWHGLTIVPVIVMAIMSTFINSGLSGILGKMELASLNLAFNVAVLVYTTAAGTRDSYPRLYLADEQQLLPDQTANLTAADQIDWIKVLRAVPIGIGQCYGCGEAVAGGLISAGILVSSPMVFYHCVMGAIIGIGTDV
uniref:Urea transporter n=1 Tax=Branchiostoma floridae TaxID=7739 RepID=C3YBW6_BRAFL|eukprot:XP_002606218.1 hypothetical protein BRAFLDRAFT_105000 [Branchiostoma floridae]